VADAFIEARIKSVPPQAWESPMVEGKPCRQDMKTYYSGNSASEIYFCRPTVSEVVFVEYDL